MLNAIYYENALSGPDFVPYGEQVVPLPYSEDEDETENCGYCGDEYLLSETEAEGFCSDACALTRALDVRVVLLQQVKLHILSNNPHAAAFTAMALVAFCRAWENSDIREALR